VTSAGLRRAATVALVGATVAVSAVGVAVATSLPAHDGSPASRFVPGDGDVSSGTGSNGTGPLSIEQEHARVRGARGFASLPTDWAGPMLTALQSAHVSLDTIELWAMRTRVAQDGTAGPQITSLYRLGEDGISQLGELGGLVPATYDPPMVVLPAHPRVGDSWSGHGAALPYGALSYRFESRITGTDTCVTVETTLWLTVSDGTELSRSSSTDTWCPSRGVVRSVGTYEAAGSEAEDVRLDMTGARSAEAFPPASSLTSAGPGRVQAAAADPARWVLEPATTSDVDRVLGTSSISGPVDVPPVITSDGLLVLAYATDGDLAGYSPDAEGLSSQWRAHPGGTVLTMAAVGRFVIAATSDRRVVCYDQLGVQRWAVAQDDLVLEPPQATGDGGVSFVALDGSVTVVDLTTGATRWQGSLVTDAVRHPLAGVGVVVATNRDGDVAAHAAVDGATRWSASGATIDGWTVDGDALVAVDDDGTVTRRLLADGSVRWSASVGGIGRSITIAGDLVVVASTDETVAFDRASGSRRWSAPASDDVVAAGADVLALRIGDRIDAVDPSGRVARTWPARPDEFGATIRTVVAAPNGVVWLVADDGEVSRLGPGTGGST
jgi:hypothetical protein